MKTLERCHRCGKTSEDTRLLTCVICHRLYCRACAVRRNGKDLCSQKCAELFFFGDGDGDDD